jgi:hypothetical protein
MGAANLDPAQRPPMEPGEGFAEGFELAEQGLVEAAEHGESTAIRLPTRSRRTSTAARVAGAYGEPDHEDSSEVPRSDG